MYRVIADPCVTNTTSSPDNNSTDYVKCKLIIPLANTTGWYVDDIIETLGTPVFDGVRPTIYVGSDFIEVDSPEAFQYLNEENSFPAGNKIINRTKTYTAYDWVQEIFINYTFAFQARDSANDCQGVTDNYTKIGRYIKIEPPTDFIDFYDEEE